MSARRDGLSTPQLALALRWDAQAVMAAFEPGANAEAIEAVTALSRDASAGTVVLHGEAGTGKSHLLQAACSQATAAGATAVYLPLRDPALASPALLDGLEGVALVALDDLDALPGRVEWQEAVFHLFNRLRAAGGSFLAAGRSRPADTVGLLADLASRLQAGLVFRLRPLDEAALRLALQRQAARRGLALPQACLDYVLTRCPRDITTLMRLLARLDEASLRAQRRVTVPLIREVLQTEAL